MRGRRGGSTKELWAGVVLAVALAAGHGLAPVAATAADGAPARAPVVHVGDVSVPEAWSGDVTASVRISVEQPLAEDLTLDVETRDLTATSGVDYRALPATKRVVLRAGRTTRFVPVRVHGDTVVEGDEQLEVAVTPIGSEPESTATGVVTVLDAGEVGVGAAAVVQIGAAEVVETDGGRSVAKVPVTLSWPLAGDLWVTVRPEDGSAVAPGDYRAVEHRFRIRAGRVSANARVAIVGDVGAEPDETLGLVLAPPADGSVRVGPHARGEVTVRDDDRPAVPGPVGELTAALLGPATLGTVELTWDPPSTGGPPDEYVVESLDLVGKWQAVYVGVPPTARHTCGVPAVTCTYRVFARNRGGDGAATVIGATTQTVPGVPTSISAEPIFDSHRFTLRWQPPGSDGGAPILRYRVRMTGDVLGGQPVPNAVWTTWTTTALSTTQDCEGTLFGDDWCYLHVRAENALGAGPWSAGVVVRTQIEPRPPKPV